MPLTRYLIRNEYGLADPELFTAADRDDPEALLEGVAMAGLVGLLRQLGDLAEFAAEIFHNLHEEVMATASRGHGLMVRVQQLEAEFPSIEKAFFSQTNNTSFLFNTGIDWHPNHHSKQNLISSGDLPRFVMDSYEDCRGPPRLFLLDKFDVAGAGACLKRYSDPSFFLLDSASSNIETQRETKLRKVKKKGSRWKNGETPDIGPASHVKLQQLLMEERIENGYTNPARLVKLKKRQMRNCGVDLKTGKSYMEKFLETPSPEQKMVCGSSVTPPCLELTSDDIGESRFKMLEISTESDVMKSPGKESASSSCYSQEALKRLMDDTITNGGIVKVIEAIPDNERRGGYPMSHNLGIENEAVDGEGDPESSMDGYLSDEIVSEVDNYMDALNTLESELETENECKSKQVGENITGSDINEEHLGIEAQLLDPQSIGNSSESDDGNISFLQGNSRPYSYNEVTVDDKLSHDRGALELFNSTPESQNSFIADVPINLVYSPDNMVKGLGIFSNTENLPILRDFSSDAKYDEPTSMVDDSKKKTEVSQEELVSIADSPRTESLSNSYAHDDAALVELDVICSEEIKEVSSTDINKFIRNGDCVESDTPLDELQSAFPTDLSLDHETSNCYVPETIGEGSDCNFSTSAFTNIDLPSSGQPGCENDEKFANIVTGAVKAEDVCDSAVDVTKTAFEAVVFELPSTNTDDRCQQDPVDLDDVPKQAFCKNVIFPAATFPDTHGFDGVHEDSHLSVDLMSLPGITEISESGAGNQQQNQAAINEAVCGGSDVEQQIKEKAIQSEDLSLLDADCKAVFLDSSLEPDDISIDYGLVQTDQNQDSPTIEEACLPQSSLELTNLHLQETSTNIEDLLTPCWLPVIESHVGSFNEMQPNQLQMEHLKAVPAISNSSNLRESEIIQSDIGRQKNEQLQSTPGDEERYSDTSPKAAQETPEAQSSQSESTQQGSCTSFDTGSHWSFKPSFVIVSEGEQVNLEEMPPLPPLPPMQWRLGKIQPAFPALHRQQVETSENQSNSIPQPKMDQTSEEFALQSSQGIVHSQNPFLIIETGEQSSNILGNTLHESEKSSSLRFPSMFNKPEHQYTSISLDDNQSLNPDVTIPMLHDDNLDSSSGQELVHSALVPSQVSTTEGGIVQHGSHSLSTNSLEPHNELLPEPGLKSKMLQQAPQNLGIEEVNTHAKLEAPFIKHEQHHSFLGVEEEVEMVSSSTVSAMVSTFEEAGQSNGKLGNKIPRPRSPLIDAVATHDKRLLRKATERVLPQAVPKVDERDSWLEQIRTKSFNLKPAVVTRPSIQGPKTNLKVAAILQRANAIRQACAGSDEDDDDDSWNESD